MKLKIAGEPLFHAMVILLSIADASMAFHVMRSVNAPSPRTKLFEQTSTMVILYHKPIDVVTTHASDDVLGRLNVYQDMMQRSRGSVPNPIPQNFPSRWHSMGRLDAATSGVLLLTNDGGLVHHVTNHRAASLTDRPLKKTYEVLVMGCHTADSPIFDQFRQGGIDLGNNQLTLPVQDLYVLDHPTAKTTRLSMSLIEGRNRQIRRMFHSCGSGVMRLTRTSIGSAPNCLTIDMVPMAGDWCLLSDETIALALGWKTRTIDEFKASVQASPKRVSSSKFTTKVQTPQKRTKSRR